MNAAAAAETAYALRPLERPPPSTPSDALEGAFRVHLSQKDLKNLGLSSGDLVRLRTADCFKGYAVAWLATQTNAGGKPIAKVSDFLRAHYHLELTDRVLIDKVVDSLKPLRSIEVGFSQPSDQRASFSSAEELIFWVRYALGRAQPADVFAHRRHLTTKQWTSISFSRAAVSL